MYESTFLFFFFSFEIYFYIAVLDKTLQCVFLVILASLAHLITKEDTCYEDILIPPLIFETENARSIHKNIEIM